jgi:hypothetical protein
MEWKLYAPIMKMANLALEKFQRTSNVTCAVTEDDITDDGGEAHTSDAQNSDVQNRGETDEGITFVRIGKRFARPHKYTSAVVPDLALVSRKTAQRVNTETTASSEREKGAQADTRRLGWHEILSFIEIHSDLSRSDFTKDRDYEDGGDTMDGDFVNSSSRESTATPALLSVSKL